MENKKILILGAGALGSNLAANLVADLRNEVDITVLDYDMVEQRNTQAGTQFYMPDQIGQFKVDALQYNVYKWYEKEISTWNLKLEKDKFSAGSFVWSDIVGKFDLVVDCLDNYEARRLIQDLKEEIEILHCGFSDKLTFEIGWAENYEVPDDNRHAKDICEMQGAGSFVKMVAALASRVALDFITEGRKRDFIGNRYSIREVA